MMRNRLLACLAVLALTTTVALAQDAAPPKPELTDFATAVPTAAAQAGRWTTLICHYDKDTWPFWAWPYPDLFGERYARPGSAEAALRADK